MSASPRLANATTLAPSARSPRPALRLAEMPAPRPAAPPRGAHPTARSALGRPQATGVARPGPQTTPAATGGAPEARDAVWRQHGRRGEQRLRVDRDHLRAVRDPLGRRHVLRRVCRPAHVRSADRSETAWPRAARASASAREKPPAPRPGSSDAPATVARRFPDAPPFVRFITPMFHPSISAQGVPYMRQLLVWQTVEPREKSLGALVSSLVSLLANDPSPEVRAWGAHVAFARAALGSSPPADASVAPRCRPPLTPPSRAADASVATMRSRRRISTSRRRSCTFRARTTTRRSTKSA